MTKAECQTRGTGHGTLAQGEVRSISSSVTQLPPGVFVTEDKFSRRRWRKVQFLMDHYWKRWEREYLPALQRRPKWIKSRRNVQPGDLVLIAEDNVIRNRWPLGRVVEVFTGEDGCVRSARIKTAGGVFHRPITKICLLEEAYYGT